MGTVKAGNLHKLSGFFKNSWKKRYFVLYQDGVFCYYQDAKDKELDGKIHMKTECRQIKVGYAVGEGVKPPKEKDVNTMFCVSSPERTWYLYADSEIEAREWIVVLEQARAPLNYGSPQPPPGGSSYTPYGAPAATVPGYPPNTPAYGAAPNAPVMGGNAPPIGFNPLVLAGAGTAGPPPPYAQGPPQPQAPYGQPSPYPTGPPVAPPGYAPYPQGIPAAQPSYPNQSYPRQPPGQYYPAPPPGQYPQQQYYPGQHTTYFQGGKPQTMYVQQPQQQRSSRNNMMMGAAAGVVGGAALGYMVGNSMGGFGHGYGGWGSDHSWSSGGSFDCGFD